MKRNSKLISKKRLLAVVNLFESKIDEEILSISLGYQGGTITTFNHEYYIDLTKNSVSKIYTDLC